MNMMTTHVVLVQRHLSTGEVVPAAELEPANHITPLALDESGAEGQS